jgi:hypothetical protein
MGLNKGWLVVVLAAGSLGGCGMFGGGSTCSGWSIKTPTGTTCSSALPPAPVMHDTAVPAPAAASTPGGTATPPQAKGAASTSTGH